MNGRRWLFVLGLVLISVLSAGTRELARATSFSQPVGNALAAAVVTPTADRWFPGSGWRAMWLAPGTELGNLYAVSAPDVHTLIAVGASGLVYRSADGGHAWGLQQVGARIDLHDVHFFDVNRGLTIGVGGTIYQTDNGGRLWHLLNSGTTEDLNALTFVDGHHGWIVGQGGTILVTKDGGTTWTSQSASTDSELRAVSFADGQNGWIVGANGTVLHTADGGQTWTLQNAGTIDELRDVLAISPTEAWLIGRGGVVRHTTDGGVSWAPYNVGAHVLLSALTTAPDGSIWIGSATGTLYHITDPTHPPTTSNIGPTQFVNDMVFLDNATFVAVGSNWLNLSGYPWGGMFIARSQDGGHTWGLVMKSICQLMDIAEPRAGVLWAVGQSCENRRLDDGHILLGSEDGGKTWFMRRLPQARRQFTVISFADAKRGVISGHGTEWNTVLNTTPTAPAFLTSDGGQTWTYKNLIDLYSDWSSIYGPVPGNNIYAGAYLSDGRIWLGGHYAILHTSQDDGATWHHLDLNDTGRRITNVEILGVAARPGGKVWLSDKAGRIIYSPDGGTYWYPMTMQRSNGSAPVIEAIQFLDDKHGWAAGYRGVLWKTTRGGTRFQDWQLVPLPAELSQVAWQDVHFFDANVGILVGGECLRAFCNFTTDFNRAVIAVTVDGGYSWSYEFLPDVKVLYAIAATSPEDVYAVGEKGVILRYSGPPTRLNAFKMAVPPTIDGDVRDWPRSGSVSLDAAHADYVDAAAPPSPSDISARVQSFWDDSALYVSVVITDNVVTDGDTFIIGLDSDRSKSLSPGDHAFRVDSQGHVTEGKTPVSGIQVGVKRVPSGWTAELAIPASLLNGNLQAGHELGVSFAFEDVDGPGVRHFFVSDGNDPATPTGDFGTIMLFGDTLVLKRGANPYSRVADAFIQREFPAANFGTSTRLQLGWDRTKRRETRSALFNFDLSFLPPAAQIADATLNARVRFRTVSGLRMDVAAYGLLKPWTEKQVTWNQAVQGQPWDTPGANGRGSDRDAEPTDTRTLNAHPTWMAWNVTDIVQRLLDGTAAGILLRPVGANTSGVYTLVASEEATDLSELPYLQFTYRLLPRPLPTPTPTPSPTATPTPSPTPTATPTPVATETPTPVAYDIYIPTLMK